MKNTIRLSGRIDSNNASDWEQQILPQIDPAQENVLDASELDYISSAGLRILMKVRKTVKGTLCVSNVSPEVYEVFSVTGFTELMQIEKRMRELSVEGCEVIGAGMFGTVYRIDAETIVKVYHMPDSLPMIRNEQRIAKLAFIKGVPTAISYDIVKVGDNYGSVFELLDASTFNDHLREHPEQFDEILLQYVDFLKVVHSAQMDPDTLPMARETFLHYLDVVREELTSHQYERMQALLRALPDDLHPVHCDFQMKNVMLVGDEPMLIDMDTMATGQPLFDLQALYVTYILFCEDDPDNLQKFLNIPDDWGPRIWNSILTNYFGTQDAQTLAVMQDKIRLVGCVRFLFLLVTGGLREGELGARRLARVKAYFAELVDAVQDLNL